MSVLSHGPAVSAERAAIGDASDADDSAGVESDLLASLLVQREGRRRPVAALPDASQHADLTVLRDDLECVEADLDLAYARFYESRVARSRGESHLAYALLAQARGLMRECGRRLRTLEGQIEE
jgi:hypothetical protein